MADAERVSSRPSRTRTAAPAFLQQHVPAGPTPRSAKWTGCAVGEYVAAHFHPSSTTGLRGPPSILQSGARPWLAAITDVTPVTEGGWWPRSILCAAAVGYRTIPAPRPACTSSAGSACGRAGSPERARRGADGCRRRRNRWPTRARPGRASEGAPAAAKTAGSGRAGSQPAPSPARHRSTPQPTGAQATRRGRRADDSNTAGPDPPLRPTNAYGPPTPSAPQGLPLRVRPLQPQAEARRPPPTYVLPPTRRSTPPPS